LFDELLIFILVNTFDSRCFRCFQLCSLRARLASSHHALGVHFRDDGALGLQSRVNLFVIPQPLTSRKRGAVAGLRRSASAVWVHFIISEAEINREHKHPEQG